MLTRQFRTFLVVGTLTICVDYATYRGLLFAEVLDPALAKGASFIAGTIFAYVANRLWTFGGAAHERGSQWRFLLLYAGTLCVNIATNAGMLMLLPAFDYRLQLAFLVATTLSATLNYFGMKYYVFTEAKHL